MMKSLIVSFALIISFSSLAQTSLTEALVSATSDSERFAANRELREDIRTTLSSFESREALNAWLESWPFGKASTRDGNDWATVISWNSESSDRVQSYSAFIVFEDKKSPNGMTWTELTHDSREDISDEGRSYRVDDWTGAIYYDIILKYDGRTPVYTLLGWDGADGLVTRKVIETITISGGRVRIGVPYIKKPEGLKKRHVFEYGDIIQVTLNYEEKQDRIVFDRLAPSDPTLEGQTAFYGPTLEYDAYTWNGKRWEFQTGVKVKNDKDVQRHRPYNDPKKRK